MAEIMWIIKEDTIGMRLDVFLSKNVASLSRSGAAQVIQKKMVKISGKQVKPGMQLKIGDKVFYTPKSPKPGGAKPQNIDIEVIYQDEDLAVINKPIGLVTHPAAGHEDGTLVNALLYHLDKLSGIGGERRPGIVHRLDKDTSGLMLVAKHDEAHQRLSAELQKRTIKRYYHAVVWGQWTQKIIDIENYLGRDPKDRKRFAVVTNGGRLAKTMITVLDQNEWMSLIQCSLHTGRTHQIRIHCYDANHPLIGDRLYSRNGEQSKLNKLKLSRPGSQLLHASKLVFDHPKSGKEMVFESSWPEPFKMFAEQAGLKKK